MHVIKKYANRKLYHTNRKQYITLDGIAALIQAGETVQVIENETGDDITAAILSQVVLATHGRSGPLPQQLLTNLIQTGSDTLVGLRRTVWSALSGSIGFHVELEHRLAALHERGLIGNDEAEHIRTLLLNHTSDTNPIPELASASDLAQLTEQVAALTDAVDQLVQSRGTIAQPTSESAHS